MAELMTPTELIGLATQELTALPACIAGSTVAAETYGLPLGQFADLDVFCYSSEAMIVGAMRLMAAGFEIEERHSRVWHRWIKYGISGWHTNSLKLMTGDGVELNLIYKKVNRHPLTSLAAVLESFDFGLLASGYDLEQGTHHDMRTYLFPDLDPTGPLPLMPQRRDGWRGGFISQYQGMRELGRYAKYIRYGYDMSLVQDDLVTGYMNAAAYMSNRTEPEKQLLSQIYYSAAEKVEANDLKDIEEFADLLVSTDQLDAIMDELE